MNSRNRATLIGFVAIVLWSSVVGLIRGVSDSFGATGGAAMIYTGAAALLLVTTGLPRLDDFPRRYLLWGSVLFVAYEWCLSLSIGNAHTARQAIEVGMVNYLWPTFTMVFAILFLRQRANLLIVPGVILAMAGVGWVLGGEHGFDTAGMVANVVDNPLSYGLASAGSLIWAAYCTVTIKIAKGKNGITPFFILVALSLWIKYLLDGEHTIVFSFNALACFVLASAAMGFGYSAWNIGIMRGNVAILAGVSYFIPVISAGLAALLLNASLSSGFWTGAFCVCGGSILCWLATRKRAPRAAASAQAEQCT
ncbi:MULTISPECIES: aromatic amino acid DMT transporter YddG [unclassified Burkholderia]|uniref:aromatic amino acid DMT transporter YddG n=1 Tax=unclassified Burkholderia TaxID=2613784 RepID=UPI002150515F|nr:MULTISPECIES: aromatic amino acid DMT transporter YddG [unclassified Burkholderia]MCR4471487.1 aromatic amino acid DMT transporter YddG [Burkholderia sp. SCN-KJ]